MPAIRFLALSATALVTLVVTSLVAPPLTATAAVPTTAPAVAPPTSAPASTGVAQGGTRPTSIVRSADASSTTVLVHGLGSSTVEMQRENRPRRHSDLQPTGRFVRQGETLTVTVPSGAPETTLGIGLYGVHAAFNGGASVGIKSIPLSPGENQVEAPLDGLVTLSSADSTGSAHVEIAGGQALPTFISGQTKQADFVAELDRFADAPFVEVIGDRLFGDFQKSSAGSIIGADDLEKRTKYWDQVVSITNGVYGLVDDATGLARKAPHRIYISSPDTGAGYASADDGRLTFSTGTKADTDLFRYGQEEGWALWHEIGHTYQSPTYGFAATIEMTVNISSMAVQVALGEPVWMDSDAWQTQIAEFFASPLETRDFSKVNHTSTGLFMFDQLRRGFGPSFYSHLHQELRVLSSRGDLAPTDDFAKKQALAVTAGQVADRDLTPFFEQWGFPLDSATRATLAALPPLTAKIWQNSHSSKPIVDHELPPYAVPVGEIAPVTEPTVVGQEQLTTPPQVTGLANSDGKGTATIAGTRVHSGKIGWNADRAEVLLTNERKVREVLSTPLAPTPGNSLLLKGMQNRPIVSVSLEPQTHQLRYLQGTTYTAHTSYVGREYLAISVHAPNGRVLRTSVVKGDETSQQIAAEADRQPYVNGQYVVVRHQQPSSGLVHYVDDAAQPARSDKEQAFRIDGDRFVSIPLSSLPVCDDGCTPTLTAPERVEVGATASVTASGLVAGERVALRVTGESKAQDLTVPGSGTVTTEIRLATAGVKTLTLQAPLSHVSLERSLLVGDDAALEPELRSLVFAPVDPADAGDTAFTGVTLPGADAALAPSAPGTRTAAVDFAATVRMPPLGATGPLQLPGNRCVVPTSSSAGAPVVGTAECDDSAAQRWQVGTDGTLRSLDPSAAPDAWWAAHQPGSDSGDSSAVVARGSSATVRLTEAALTIRPLTASVGTVYADVRWAQLSGVATPGAELRIGEQKVTADASTGAWATTVKGLKAGDNALEIRQVVHGHEVGTTKITVPVGDPGPASLIAAPVSPIALESGTSTAVPFVLQNVIQRKSLTAAIELTAPVGTTFAPGQVEIIAEYQKKGTTSWAKSTTGTITNGTLSEDGTTLHFDLDWSGSGVSIEPEMKLRWSPVIVTPEGVKPGESSMRFTVSDPRPTVGFLIEAEAPVTIDAPTLVPGAPSTTELARGGVTEIPVIVTNLVQRSSMQGTVTVTAPEGTRFSGQTSIAAYYQYNGSAWLSWPRLDLKNGTLSDDGRSMTFTFDTGSGQNLRADESYRFLVKVTTPTDAAGGNSTLDFDFAGTSSHGKIRAQGRVDTHLADLEGAVVAPSVVSPAAGSTVDSSRPVFSGRGQKGARISVGYGTKAIIGSATVTDKGEWTLAPTAGLGLGTSTLTVMQTSGSDTKTAQHTINRVATKAPFRVTSHVDGQLYAEEVTTFRGTSHFGAVITAVNQWGTPMGTAVADSNGTWSFARILGPTALGYDITFTATYGDDRETTTLHLGQEKNSPVHITSIGDGDTYTPGQNVLEGTGTPGATVSAVNATNGWNVPMGSARVATDGTWALPARSWGPANDYQIRVTQVNPDTTSATTTVSVKAPR